MLHDLVYLLITFGILAAIAGYSWAGIRYMWDDIEGHRRAKRLIQNVTIGLLILLFAQPLVSYLVVRLAGC